MHAFAQTTLGDPMNVINEGVEFCNTVPQESRRDNDDMVTGT